MIDGIGNYKCDVIVDRKIFFKNGIIKLKKYNNLEFEIDIYSTVFGIIIKFENEENKKEMVNIKIKNINKVFGFDEYSPNTPFTDEDDEDIEWCIAPVYIYSSQIISDPCKDNKDGKEKDKIV